MTTAELDIDSLHMTMQKSEPRQDDYIQTQEYKFTNGRKTNREWHSQIAEPKKLMHCIASVHKSEPL